MTIEELDNLPRPFIPILIKGCHRCRYDYYKEPVRIFITYNLTSNKYRYDIVYHALCRFHGAKRFSSFIDGKELSVQDIFYLRLKYNL